MKNTFPKNTQTNFRSYKWNYGVKIYHDRATTQCEKTLLWPLMQPLRLLLETTPSIDHYR